MQEQKGTDTAILSWPSSPRLLGAVPAAHTGNWPCYLKAQPLLGMVTPYLPARLERK